jgi:hypothetical protein
MTAIWQVLMLVLVAAVAVQAIVLVAVMRQVGSLQLQIRPSRVGDIEGGPEIGSVVDVAGVDPERPAILIFISPGCAVCGQVLLAIPAVRTHYPEIGLIGAIIGGDKAGREAFAPKVGEIARPDLYALGDEWDVPGTPYAVGLTPGGRVHSCGVVNSLDQLESLAETLLRAETDQQVPAAEPASHNGHHHEHAAV